jgi:hypothetical protein
VRRAGHPVGHGRPVHTLTAPPVATTVQLLVTPAVGSGRSCLACWRKLVSETARGSSFPIESEVADQSAKFSGVGQVTLAAMEVAHENWPVLVLCWQNKTSPC